MPKTVRSDFQKEKMGESWMARWLRTVEGCLRSSPQVPSLACELPQASEGRRTGIFVIWDAGGYCSVHGICARVSLKIQVFSWMTASDMGVKDWDIRRGWWIGWLWLSSLTVTLTLNLILDTYLGKALPEQRQWNDKKKGHFCGEWPTG